MSLDSDAKRGSSQGRSQPALSPSGFNQASPKRGCWFVQRWRLGFEKMENKEELGCAMVHPQWLDGFDI